MADRTTPMRIGLISIFALVIVVCLAVMAVLAHATSSATQALAERQAQATQAVYANEAQAQRILAVVEDSLAASRQQGVTGQAAVDAVKRDLVQYRGTYRHDEHGGVAIDSLGVIGMPEALEIAGLANATSEALGAVHASISNPNGRGLEVIIALDPDATCAVLAWKATTAWEESMDEQDLWEGPQ